MSSKMKKASTAVLAKQKKVKVKTGIETDINCSKRVSINGRELTPTHSIGNVSVAHKKNPKSSMKKIKKFLKSRSKKKLTSVDSLSLDCTLDPDCTLPIKQTLCDSTSPVNTRLSGRLKMHSDASSKLEKSDGNSVSKRRRSTATVSTDNIIPDKRRRVTDTDHSSSSTINQSRRCSTTNSQSQNSNGTMGFIQQTCSGSRRSMAPPGERSVSLLSLAPPGESVYNSSDEAAKLFAYMIEPVMPAKFFKEIWEKKPLLVRRHSPQHNEGWFSTQLLDHIFRHEHVNFTDNVDVVTYINGKRETHNPTGRAYAPVVWDHYQTGCSVRLLNPHAYSDTVWNALSLLQEYFSCVAGANVYLTPPCSQGFAPHWDDIEAFILQLEGKKHWRVYEPRNESEVLPQYSSQNFTDADLPSAPLLDVILEPGDLLYFPRGFIHQGETLEGTHSLHITVSVGQKNTWGDLLRKLVPRALDVAIEEDVEFRRSLPRDYFNYMGVAFSDESGADRSKFVKNIERLLTKLLSSAPVDAACDQMAKEFLQNTLPPVLTDAEKQRSVHGCGEHWDEQQSRVRGTIEIEPDTEIKIIRRGCLRLLVEDDKVFVYHNIQNTRTLYGANVECVEVESQMAEAVEFLLKQYPEFVSVDDLPLDNVQDRVALAVSLYDRGLVMTREPVDPMSGSDSDCSDTVAN